MTRIVMNILDMNNNIEYRMLYIVYKHKAIIYLNIPLLKEQLIILIIYRNALASLSSVLAWNNCWHVQSTLEHKTESAMQAPNPV